jgi:hypothetical protein
MDYSFRPKIASRASCQLDYPTVPYPTIANSTTTTVALGSNANNAYVLNGFVSQLTLGTSGGTVTVTIKKWDVGANAFVNLTAATDLLTATQTAKQTYTIPILGTVTDAQRTVHGTLGDTLYADFIASGTVSAQPTLGIVGCETALLI